MSERAAWTKRYGERPRPGGYGESPRPKRNKFNAKPRVVDGIRFASRAEAARYEALKLMERAGMISGLGCHPVFVLTTKQRHHPWREEVIGRYIADFRYYVLKTARVVIEDVKGGPTHTPLSKWKIKHAQIEHGIKVEIVR